MRFFFHNRKAFSTVEYIVIFFAITAAIIATTRLVKGSWNFKIDSMERGLHNSFYDHMKPGEISLQEGCECTDWVNVGCAKSICGPCDNLSYRGCRPMGCSPDGDADGSNTQKCIPSVDDPNTPGDESCPGDDNAGCGTDQPPGPNGYPGLCPWGTHVQVDSDCANPIVDPACPSCPPTYEEEISCIADTDCEFECGGINFDLNGDGIPDNIYIPCDTVDADGNGVPDGSQAPTPTTPSTVLDLCPPNPGPCVFACANLTGDFDLVAKDGACVCEKTLPDALEFDLATMTCFCPDHPDTCSGTPICSPLDCNLTFCDYDYTHVLDCNPDPDIYEPCFDCVNILGCGDFPASDCPDPCTVENGAPGECIPVGGGGGGGECQATTSCADAGQPPPDLCLYAPENCPVALGCMLECTEEIDPDTGLPVVNFYLCFGSYSCAGLDPWQCAGWPDVCEWVL